MESQENNPQAEQSGTSYPPLLAESKMFNEQAYNFSRFSLVHQTMLTTQALRIVQRNPMFSPLIKILRIFLDFNIGLHGAPNTIEQKIESICCFCKINWGEEGIVEMYNLRLLLADMLLLEEPETQTYRAKYFSSAVPMIMTPPTQHPTPTSTVSAATPSSSSSEPAPKRSRKRSSEEKEMSVHRRNNNRPPKLLIRLWFPPDKTMEYWTWTNEQFIGWLRNFCYDEATINLFKNAKTDGQTLINQDPDFAIFENYGLHPAMLKMIQSNFLILKDHNRCFGNLGVIKLPPNFCSSVVRI